MNRDSQLQRIAELQTVIETGAAFREFRESKVHKHFTSLWEQSLRGLNDIGSFEFKVDSPSIESQVVGRKIAQLYVQANFDFINQRIDEGKFAEAELERLQSASAIMGEIQDEGSGS